MISSRWKQVCQIVDLTVGTDDRVNSIEREKSDEYISDSKEIDEHEDGTCGYHYCSSFGRNENQWNILLEPQRKELAKLT